METSDLLGNVSDNVRSIRFRHANNQSHLINRITSKLLELKNATPDRGADKSPIGKSSFFRTISCFLVKQYKWQDWFRQSCIVLRAGPGLRKIHLELCRPPQKSALFSGT